MINILFLLLIGLSSWVFMMGQCGKHVNSFLALIGAFTVSTTFTLIISAIIFNYLDMPIDMLFPAH